MAFDAVIFIRTRVRGTPSWPGHNPETGYVGADRSDHLAQTPCGRGGPYVFMRTRVRGTPSWPGHDPETGYVGADRSDHLAQTPCGRGGPYVFICEAQAAEQAR